MTSDGRFYLTSAFAWADEARPLGHTRLVIPWRGRFSSRIPAENPTFEGITSLLLEAEPDQARRNSLSRDREVYEVDGAVGDEDADVAWALFVAAEG